MRGSGAKVLRRGTRQQWPVALMAADLRARAHAARSKAQCRLAWLEHGQAGCSRDALQGCAVYGFEEQAVVVSRASRIGVAIQNPNGALAREDNKAEPTGCGYVEIAIVNDTVVSSCVVATKKSRAAAEQLGYIEVIEELWINWHL